MNRQEQITQIIKKQLQSLIETFNNDDFNLFQTKFGQQLIMAQIIQQEDLFILYLEFVIKNYYIDSYTLLDGIFQIIRTSQAPQQSINQSIIQEFQTKQIQINQITHKCQCIDQIQNLLNKQMIELEQQLKQIKMKSSLIHNPQSKLQLNGSIQNQQRSELITCQVNCIYCNLSIKTNIIQLNCLHCYHQECLQTSILNKMQLYEEIPYLTCDCGKKINMQVLKNFDNEIQAYAIKEKLLLSQLQHFRTSYISKYMACDNYQFYSKVQSEPTMNRKQDYYCPVCIGNYRFNTVFMKT